MSKFKVLRINQLYMSQLAFLPNHLIEPTNDFFETIFFYSVLGFMASVFFGSAVFAIKNSQDVKRALGAFKICFGTFQCSGMTWGIKRKMIKIKALQVELQRIVDEDEDNRELHNIYWECEQKCRKHTQKFSYLIIFHNTIFPIVFAYVLTCIAVGNYDTSSWFLPMSMVVPFDRTVFGWFLKWFAEFVGSFTFATSMTTITSYFVSCCYYICAMCDHFKLLINSVTNDVERMQMEENPGESRKIRKQIQAQLCNIVKFHIKISEIFHMLEDINSIVIFVLLPANVLFMSIALYDVEISVLNFEPSFLLFDVSCILCALFWPAFFCYSASHATDRISSIGDMLYNSNWIEYPPKLRKHVILMIARSQETVYFSGLGLIRCTLEVFGKLCQKSTSYYMIFRAIDRR